MYKPPTSLYIEQARNRTLLMHEAQLRKHSRRKKYKTKKSLSNCSNTRDTIDRKGTKKKMGTVNNIIQNNDPLLMSDNPIPYLTIGRNSPEPTTPNPPEHQDSASISNNVPRQSQKVGNSISESTKEEKSKDIAQTAVLCLNEVQPFVPPSVLNKPKIATSCDIEKEIVKDTGNCDQSCESLPRVHPALSLSVYFKLQKQKLNEIEILLSEMQQKNVNPQKSPQDEQDLSVEMSECSATTQAMRLPSTPHYSIITTDTDSLKVRLRRSGGMVETDINEQNAFSPVTSLENNRHILTGEDVNMYLNLQGMKATSTASEIQESSIHNETERNNMQHSIPGNKQTIRHNCLFAPRTIDNGSYQHYTYNRATQALTLECKQKVTSHKVNVRIKSTTDDEVMPKQKIIGSIISTDNAVTFKPVSDNQSTLYSTTSLAVDNKVQKPNNHSQQNNYNIQNPAPMHSYEEKNGHETKPQDKMGTTKPALSKDISKLIKVKSPTAQSIFEILQAELNSDDNSTVMGIDEKKNKSQNISCNQEDKFNFKLKNDRNDVNKTQPLKVKSSEYKSFKTNKDSSKSAIPNFYSNVKTSPNNIMGLTPTKDLNKRKDESLKRISEHDISVHTKTTNGYRLAANKQNFSVPSTAILVSVTTKQNSNGLLPTIENVFFKEGPVSGKHQNGGTPRQHESSKLTTERKVFCCNYPACNYTSNRQSHLNVHILGHTNDKTHKCTICSYGYNLRWKLEIHMKTAHKGKTDNQQNENEHQSTLDTPEKNSKEFKQEDMNDQNKEIDTLLVTEKLPETVEKVDENVQENLKPEDEKKNNQINTFLTDYLACFDELLSDDDDEYDINDQPTGSINHGKEDTLVDEDPIVHEAPDNNCCVSDPVESNTYEVNTLLSGSDSTSNGSVPNLCCMKRKIPGTGTHINCQTKRRKVKQ